MSASLNRTGSRGYQSLDARVVGDVLREYANCGAIQDLHAGGMRVGRIAFRWLWHGAGGYRFIFDQESSEMFFPALLHGMAEDSAEFKQLRRLARWNVAADGTDQPRLDPLKGELRSFVRHGAVTLSVTVRRGEYAYCTRCIIQLADELLRRFPGNRHTANPILKPKKALKKLCR